MGARLLILAAALCGAIPLSLARQTAPSALPTAQDDAGVRATCGTCHALPPADVLPRDAWGPEVVRMQFIREGRLPPTGNNAAAVELQPDMARALAYYKARAPERLPAPEPWPAASESPLAF